MLYFRFECNSRSPIIKWDVTVIFHIFFQSLISFTAINNDKCSEPPLKTVMLGTDLYELLR